MGIEQEPSAAPTFAGGTYKTPKRGETPRNRCTIMVKHRFEKIGKRGGTRHAGICWRRVRNPGCGGKPLNRGNLMAKRASRKNGMREGKPPRRHDKMVTFNALCVIRFPLNIPQIRPSPFPGFFETKVCLRLIVLYIVYIVNTRNKKMNHVGTHLFYFVFVFFLE